MEIHSPYFFVGENLMTKYGKIDEEKEPITTAAAKALEQTYARLS
jgi:hypothetical protein